MSRKTAHDDSSAWNMSDLHEKSTVPSSAADKQKVYAAWSSTYDAEVLANGYSAPSSIVGKAIEFILDKLSGVQAILVLDAGCGTGLVAEQIRKRLHNQPGDVEIIGVDFSSDMLQLAKMKAVYDRLYQADLNIPLSVPEKSVDLGLSCGVFLEGHCGPSALQHLLGHLKEGGVFIITVRESAYKLEEEKYLRVVKISGCEIISNELSPYLGPVLAHFVTIQKPAGPGNVEQYPDL